jgi:hypothetical protein
LPALAVRELLHCEVDALDTRGVCSACVIFFVETVSVHIVLVFTY